MTREIVIILVLVALNGLFSAAELSIISARRNRMEEKAEKGSRGARAAIDLAADPNRILSTVQIGITLIGILSGAFGGATLAESITAAALRNPTLAPWAETIGISVVVVSITLLTLIFGELVPKRLAMASAEKIAESFAPLMNVVAWITYPLVRVLSAATDGILKALGVREVVETEVTEDDVRSMIDTGTRLGVFEESEQEMVSQVFELGDTRVSTIMTPRTQITFIDVQDTHQEMIEEIVNSGFSRFPVYDDTPDHVIGMILVKDLFNQLVKNKNLEIKSSLHPVLFVPEAASILEVLERMKQTSEETALVVDEYGGVSGLVTITDILESIVGDVEMPQPGEEPDVIQREDGSYLLDGRIPNDEVKELLDIDGLPEESEGSYESLGGMMMAVLGRIPTSGDHFEWQGFRFEVVDMDGHRVDKVMAARAELKPPAI